MLKLLIEINWVSFSLFLGRKILPLSFGVEWNNHEAIDWFKHGREDMVSCSNFLIGTSDVTNQLFT